MALYDYKCNSCGATFEVSHTMNFNGIVVCSSCSSQNTRKLLGNCRFNTGQDLGPTSAHLISEQRENSKVERGRVETALNKMTPDSHNAPQEHAHAGCVHHTRIELEERYGDIFPRKT